MSISGHTFGLVLTTTIGVLLLLGLQATTSHQGNCQANYATAYFVPVSQKFVSSPDANIADGFTKVLVSAAAHQEVYTNRMGIEEGSIVYLDTKDRALTQRSLSLAVRQSPMFGTEVKLKHYSNLSACDSDSTMRDNNKYLYNPYSGVGAGFFTFYQSSVYSNDFVSWGVVPPPFPNAYFTSSLAFTHSSTFFGEQLKTFSDVSEIFPGLLDIPVRPQEPMVPVHAVALTELVIGNITIVHGAGTKSEARLTVLRQNGKFLHSSVRIRSVPQSVVLTGHLNVNFVSPESSLATRDYYVNFTKAGQTSLGSLGSLVDAPSGVLTEWDYVKSSDAPTAGLR